MSLQITPDCHHMFHLLHLSRLFFPHMACGQSFNKFAITWLYSLSRGCILFKIGETEVSKLEVVDIAPRFQEKVSFGM
jgi:hypothetical protein